MVVQESHLVQLFIDNIHDRLWNDFILQARSEFLVDGVLVVFLETELFLYYFQLFLQHVFSVLGLNFLLDLTAYFLLEPAEFQFFFKKRQRQHESLGNLLML